MKSKNFKLVFIKFKLLIFLFFTLVFFNAQTLSCEAASLSVNSPVEKSSLALDDIIERVENRYNVSSFSARFAQASTLKAMEITDTASGLIFVKRPGMMRWVYENPERQIIITDGNILWIYRPEENQVMVGKAPAFFGNGKGAGFLSDIKLIRKKFSIFLEKKESDDYHVLKLLPKEQSIDLSVIYLSISKKTFDIVQIVTHNSYGDETRIELSNIQFKQHLDDSIFSFKIPEGVDILQIDE